MTVNKKAKPAKVHLNWMGGNSFDISDPFLRLRLAASTCFFGEPQYYHDDDDNTARRVQYPSLLSSGQLDDLRETLQAIDPQEWRGMNPQQLMESAIDAALEADPEKTLQEAVRLRNEEHIRTTPQVILVRAANHKKVKGTGLVRKYAKQIMTRADEPSVCMAYQLAIYGKDKPIPNSLKRACADVLESCNEYNLAKYRMEDRVVKTVDVMNLVHPKSKAIEKLSKGELKTTDKTWEAMVSGKGSTKENWTKALEVMGHMALLRNVRNLLKNGVEPKLFIKQLVEGAEEGKQLPFRYYSAYQAVAEAIRPVPGAIQDAIETCLMRSLKNLPEFPGKTMSLSDNSGSARGATTSKMGTMAVATIGNLTGVLAGMRSDEGYLGIFGDDLDVLTIRKNSSVFDQLDKAEKAASKMGGDTENGIWLFWDKAIKQKEHWDNVFVFSDMQAGHGGLYGVNPKDYQQYMINDNHIDVAKLVSVYRDRVNPDVNVFLVQIDGYQDTLIPEFYTRTYILGGWGEGLLRFAAEMAGLLKKAA